MRRRGAGVGRIKKKLDKKEKLAEKADVLEDELLTHIQQQLATFKDRLEVFAKEHKEEIKRDPVFRHQFQKMCSQVGVDPLASSKGFWSTLLGVGDFYYELAIQAIDVCLQTRRMNGGLIAMDKLIALIMAKRGTQSQTISEEDVQQAIKSIGVLGNGFKVIALEGASMVISVPMELNQDHSTLLQLASQHEGYCTVEEVMSSKQWTKQRVDRVMTHMLEEGMIWIDEGIQPTRYYFPSIFYRNS